MKDIQITTNNTYNREPRLLTIKLMKDKNEKFKKRTKSKMKYQ